MNPVRKSVFMIFVWMSFVFLVTGRLFAQFNSELFQGMKARSIGPAGMSGRIADIEAVEANSDIIYVGAATGGLWKSTNGGITWESLFDDQPVSSIGDVEVFQQNPSIVWVGTGEGNPRNSVGVGNGAFKSLDGGHTWKFIGLEKTEKIHRIVLHPTDPDVAYAGALGTTWGENPERGVFKTTDGGKTWKKILFVDGKTGCADLVMDPTNPNKLFAAMWQHRRYPWFFNSGGPGSGLYVTYDGGENWKKITADDGLPQGDLGRIGIAIARNEPSVVYALVEAKKSALCRSDDGGRTWRIVNNSSGVNPRPFYYCDIRVDPQNENRIYSLRSRLTFSEDGGKSFQSIRSRVHSDHHALWIHPQNGNFLIDGNDGGIAISYDRGKTWRFIENLPVAQFYHINVDMEIPYHVYGGMQDNGSWRGPSDVWENGGIRNFHWNEVGFGDGFATLCDPSDPNSGYSMSQGGHLHRFSLVTGERKDIRPPAPDSVELRFNWNAAIAVDPFDTKTIYYGSQFIHKSVDRGDSWTIISPDLTTNDPEKQRQAESGGLTYDVTDAENHTTIITIAPSPVQQGVIWVGTDDGNVQITHNGGDTWTNVVKNIRDLPAHTWCPHIEASKFDAATAYAVFDDHRRSNWTTYIYKTEDFGEHWRSLTRNDPTKEFKTTEQWGFAHVIEQDPVEKRLLYLGTEFGLYISFDDGEHWMKWTNGVPTVPVRALIVHPREDDLIIGTHGRAAFILDNIRPLRAISQELLQQKIHLFEIPSTYLHEIKQMDGYHFPADAQYVGESKQYGAMITYYLKPELVSQQQEKPAARKEDKTGTQENERTNKKKKVKIEIMNSNNEVIRSFDAPMEKGINRVYWDLRYDGFDRPQFTERERGYGYTPRGPEALPGKYMVKIQLGDLEATQSVEVLADPRINILMADRQQKFNTIMQVTTKIDVTAEAVNRLRKTNKTIEIVLDKLKEKDGETANVLKKDGKALQKRLKEVAKLFVAVPEGKQGLVREDNVSRKLSSVYGSLSTSYDKPTSSQLTYLHQAESELEKALEVFNDFFEKDVSDFQQKVKDSDFQLFEPIETLDVNWKPQ